MTLRPSLLSSLLSSLLVLLTAGPAQGALQAIEQAYELALSEITLPGNENGYVMVRRCARCKPEVMRVDARTVYRVRPASNPVSLRELKIQAGKAIGSRQASVYLYYDPKTRYVRRLVLDAAQLQAGQAP